MGKAEVFAVLLGAMMMWTRPSHQHFKRSLRARARARAGFAGGLLASLGSIAMDASGLFVHRDMILFTVEHADIPFDQQEVIESLEVLFDLVVAHFTVETVLQVVHTHFD